MIRIVFIAVLGFFMVGSGAGQNAGRFFKTLPAVDAGTPEWARMMYSPNPNIKQVEFEFEKYYETHPFEKSVHTQNYKHWRRFADEYMNAEGFIQMPDQELWQRQLDQRQSRSNLKSGGNGWIPVGPFRTYAAGDQPDLTVSWQVNVYCFDQSESRPEILYAGTEAGGLFKSVDKGLNWQLVTGDVPVTTINDVKVSATNPDILFFTANQRIYRSMDGGATWDQVYVIGADGYQLLIHPTDPQLVFCAADNGLVRSVDGGANWTRLKNNRCWDIKIHPVNPDVIYLIASNSVAKRAEFLKSSDRGATFTIRDTGWYVPANTAAATDQGAKIGVTPAAPDLVYVALIGESKAGDNGWIGLYRSSDQGETWMNPNLPDGGPYTSARQNPASFNPDGTGFHQGFYDFALAVSHVDPDKLWLGTINFLRSTNGGASWTRIGSYYAQQDIGWIHPDIQDLHVRGNEIFVCSDGGINFSTDELRTHENRNRGLAGSDYWGFGQGWNDDVMVGGRYHNGNSGYYGSYGTGNSLRLGGAEAPTGYVNPMENRKAYFSDINSVILPKTMDEPVVSFQKLGKYPIENYTESYSSEIEWDPRYGGHLYLGESGKIWKSTDGGGYFEALYSFGSGKVLEIEVSRSDPRVIYCVFQPKGGYWDACGLRKTNDGGKTWSVLPVVPTNDRFRLEIALNPENADELWAIAVNGSNGRKVYRTLDGGKTWESKNSELFNDERPLDIQFQGGTDGVVYLATNRGAYVYDPASGSWAEWMDGLPTDTRVMEMKPYYNGSRIRMATGGRGIWERPLYAGSRPVAMPMTFTDTLFNPNDTVAFESHSIVRNEGAAWEWTFQPEPSWVSSKTVRNPRVIFGSKGSYDVTLTITDAEGKTSTRTIPAMVTIADPPAPDQLAGKALECAEAGEYAVTDPIGLRSNVFSITAWVKPDGIQPDYTGIVMNTGTAAGFNFRGGNNTLGYHWPGGSWSWDSKLIVPAGRWSHVALVANGTSMTLYVNGIPSRHTAPLQSVQLNTFNIGSYMGWESRNFKGQIDEVCMWNRALTQEEIREKAHLVLAEVSANPGLVGYYQFNETGGRLFNRAAPGIGSLMGETGKVASSAPVGEGTSARLNMNAVGLYDFENTGISVRIPSGSLYPGETVATRIQSRPTIRPNTNPDLGCYWILEAYGNDHFAPIMEISLTPAEGEAADTVVQVPSHAGLYQRMAGFDDNSWEKLAVATSVAPGPGSAFVFGSLAGPAGSAQITVASDRSSVPLLKGNTSGISGTERIDPAGFTLWPNPVIQGEPVTIESEGPMQRIRVYSADGKLVQDIVPGGESNVQIHPASLAPGTFLVRVTGEKFISTRILVVR